MSARSQTPARIVVLLADRGPMTAPQIAEALGIHRATVSDHAHAVFRFLEREQLTYLRGKPVVYRAVGDSRPFTSAVPPAPKAAAPHERRADTAIVNALRERGPSLVSQLVTATGLHRRTIATALERLGPQVETTKLGDEQGTPVVYRLLGDDRPFVMPLRPPTGDAKPKTEQRPGLPMLARGYGERDETCAGYSACLGRFARAGQGNWGHCPEDCSRRAPTDPRVERDEIAMRRDRAAMAF